MTIFQSSDAKALAQETPKPKKVKCTVSLDEKAFSS